MRWKIIFIILLILAGVHFFTGPVLAKLYNTHCGKFLGTPTYVEKVSFDLLNRVITVKNLRIFKMERNSQPLLSIDYAIIDFKILPLLSRKIRLRELTISTASLNLPKDEDRTLIKNLANRIFCRENGQRKTNTAPFLEKKYTLRKARHGYNVIYPAQRKSPLLFIREMNIKNLSLILGNDVDPMAPPSFSDLNIRFKDFCTEKLPAQYSTQFIAEGRVIGHPDSIVKMAGTCKITNSGLNTNFMLTALNINLPSIWPYLVLQANDSDLSSLIVNTGIIDMEAETKYSGNDLRLAAKMAFRRLNIASVSGNKHDPLAGNNRDLIIRAINSVENFAIEFSDHGEWKKTLNEVVMKGVRNLIRQEIKKMLFNRP